MQLIVVRQTKDNGPDGGAGLLRYALSTAPLRDVVLDGLHHLWESWRNRELAVRMGGTTAARSCWVLPRDWQGGPVVAPDPTVFYDDSWCWEAEGRGDRCRQAWAVITHGRFAACASPLLLERLIRTTAADCLAVTVASDLLACREKPRLTSDNKVVGYRRLYADSMSLAPMPTDWPHYLLVRREALDTALESGLLSPFGAWVDACRSAGLRLQGATVAGSVYDLESEEGIRGVSHLALNRSPRAVPARRLVEGRRLPVPGEGDEISSEARLIGPVRLGGGVTIETGAVVVGPAVLCDGCTIGAGAVVDSAIVGAGASIAPNQVIEGGLVLVARREAAAQRPAVPAVRLAPVQVCPPSREVFRTWPRFSYARCFKRMVDVVAALVVIILFAPVLPVIVLAIKLNSPGPVFFRDMRQGLHGRPFRCVKFRTMRPGADKIQDKLRFVSDVDGPQFKMTDDPRITTVGRFLRETYLDEIPQFLNVLWGQMSVVGPRPSPESENTLCPSWRDARLSVRPGITGLWQVLRTREPQKDFQEWIHYDTRYVREFSFGLDLWICWRTFRKMLENFVSQF
jgi:lipopolysaccharide/colanic/teichoic acid biosynthesis glycosyltransferase/carbonic anhydrase/acetyltransferase-like protein (isoleucine patch superfamily)